MKAEDLLNQLSESGRVHLVDSDNKDAYNYLAGSLGKVLNKSSIKVKPDSDQFIHSSGYVEFHTDDPRADFIAWKCIKPADFGGENILKNLYLAYSRLNIKHKNILKTVRIIVNIPGAPYDVPFLQEDNKYGVRFYYAPWKVLSNRDSDKDEALFYLNLSLKEELSERILLSEGDILIVNNRFIVHGREPYIGIDRHLERTLISIS